MYGGTRGREKPLGKDVATFGTSLGGLAFNVKSHFSVCSCTGYKLLLLKEGASVITCLDDREPGTTCSSRMKLVDTLWLQTSRTPRQHTCQQV